VASGWYKAVKQITVKMNQTKLIVEIAAVLPELEPEITRTANGKNPFAVVRSVTRYTRKMIEQHNDLMVDKCMKLIGNIYIKGDAVLKTAVTDVSVFSLDAVLASCILSHRKRLINILPQSLQAVYLKQIYSSAI